MDRRNSTKPIIAGVNLNNPTETFKVVMILCLIIFVAAVLFFSTLRLKFRQIYSPRLLLIENKIFTIGTMPRPFFSWISPSILTTDDDIYTFSGIDALVFIRFLKLILKLALFTLPYGMIVLLPININGGYQLADGLDRLSMSNIKASSSLLWAHCLAVWLYTFAIIYLTFEEWKVYIKYRQSYLKKGTSSQFAIFLQNIPEQVSWYILSLGHTHRLTFVCIIEIMPKIIIVSNSFQGGHLSQKSSKFQKIEKLPRKNLQNFILFL